MRMYNTIGLQAFLFAFMFFLAGHDMVSFLNDSTKTENTCNSTAPCNYFDADCSSEEELSYILHQRTAQKITTCGRNVIIPVSFLLPTISYSIWLPPENS